MGLIKNDFIEKMKDTADITEIVGVFCKDLKKRGANYFCSSPFSKDNTPSFCVDPVRQRFKDFSSGKSGNAITFLMEHERFSFPEAIEWLARHYGYDVEYETEEWAKKKAEEKERKESLRPLLIAAHRQYVKAFNELPKDHPARDEIRKRDYSRETVSDWEIGYAPGKQFLYEMIMEKGLTKEARELGLIGDKADKYWERVIYPIRDKNGLLVGLAGRDVSGRNNSAKWINPPESILYKKEKIWFGLDRAARAIYQLGEAWIVEGYNDVIAWHLKGLENTIAPCGTAITPAQIEALKKITGKVVLCMDGDAAGMKSMVKYIPEFLKAGLGVEVVKLPDLDPDDFCRRWHSSIEKYTLPGMMNEEGIRIDGFQILLDHYLDKGNKVQKAKAAKELSLLIGELKDDYLREVYSEWLAKFSGMKPTNIKAWVKEKLADQDTEEITTLYVFPKEVKGQEKDLIPVVEKYGMFQANKRIYMMFGSEAPFAFKPVSNFSIEVIQHMQDEKFPMKLVRICNVANEERIFDIPSADINTPQAFDNAMTNQGNFLFEGNRADLNRLRAYLFDNMGVGSKIDILGWQNEGFWVFNNKVIVPGQNPVDINENGVFRFKEVCYYIPSANKIYKNSILKYQPQKKLRLQLKSKTTFTEYAGKIIEVHGSNGLTAILFTIASIFQDIVVERLGNFPMMFFYGPASSGKDQLIECCQSFFGEPQVALNLEGGVSTAKAHVRELAQFQNMISHLSEYQNGDPKLNGVLKGFWDRRGYKRGNLDSHVGTDVIPILCSVMMTGNFYPDSDALITRLVVEEMTKTDFTPEETKRYDELKDMTKAGVSHLVLEILQYRENIEANFLDVFRATMNTLKQDLNMQAVPSRILSNTAVLGAFYHLFKDVIMFPFGWQDYLEHMKISIDRQLRKLNTASIGMKWWDCFLAAIRTKQDPLRHGREFEVKDNKLFFNFTHTYMRVSSQWWSQYHEQTPSKSKVADTIKKESFFLEEKGSHRMEHAKTSVWVIDLGQLPMKEDLISAVEWQQQENGQTNMFNSGSPATPNGENDKDELPF